MKTILGIFLMTMALGAAALAQGGGETPAYSAPKAEEIKEFTSQSGKFKADFPGEVKTRTNPEVVGFAAYYLSRAGSNTSVTVNEFSGDSEKQKTAIYQHVKDSLLKLPQAKIISETDFDVGTRKGKEFVVTYDEGRVYAKIRILPAGKRIYEIKTDLINWHKISDDVKKEFETETARFFGSFKLLEK